MRVPEGETHAMLHVITENHGVAVSTSSYSGIISSSSSSSSSDQHWVRPKSPSKRAICHTLRRLFCTSTAHSCAPQRPATAQTAASCPSTASHQALMCSWPSLRMRKAMLLLPAAAGSESLTRTDAACRATSQLGFVISSVDECSRAPASSLH
jgi:hypothetical protein